MGKTNEETYRLAPCGFARVHYLTYRAAGDKVGMGRMKKIETALRGMTDAQTDAVIKLLHEERNHVVITD